MIRGLINLMIASMIFFPAKDFPLMPEHLGLNAQDVFVKTEDGVHLHGWFFPVEKSQFCLLLFHGNAGNISLRLPKAKAWTDRGVSVLLIDYRGYGKSEGEIKSSADLTKDAKAALDWLKRKRNYATTQIILYGESLGAVPAIELAGHELFKAVILEAPFTSLKDMAKMLYGMAPDFLLKDFEMNNEEKITRLKSPVFFLQGTDDEVVPFSMGQRLFQLAPEPKGFFKVKGGRHNDLAEKAGEDYYAKPYEFVQRTY